MAVNGASLFLCVPPSGTGLQPLQRGCFSYGTRKNACSGARLKVLHAFEANTGAATSTKIKTVSRCKLDCGASVVHKHLKSHRKNIEHKSHMKLFTQLSFHERAAFNLRSARADTHTHTYIKKKTLATTQWRCNMASCQSARKSEDQPTFFYSLYKNKS